MHLTDFGAVVQGLGRRDETHFAVTLAGHQNHALGLDAENRTRLQVREDADLLAYHLLRSVELGDTGHDDSLVNARIYGELQQLIRFRDLDSLQNRGSTDIHLSEIIELHFILLRSHLICCSSFSAASRAARMTSRRSV